MRSRRVLLGAGLLACTLLMTACPARKSIREVLDDPGKYSHEEVTITGRVTESYGAFNEGVYEIDDGTGSIWVYSRGRGVPRKGAAVGVKGRILTDGVTYGSRNYGTVFKESDRRTSDKY